MCVCVSSLPACRVKPKKLQHKTHVCVYVAPVWRPETSKEVAIMRKGRRVQVLKCSRLETTKC